MDNSNLTLILSDMLNKTKYIKIKMQYYFTCNKQR